MFESLAGYSNADLEAVALLALEFAKRGDGIISAPIFEDAVKDFMPPRFQAMSPAEVHKQLSALKRAIQD